MIFILTIFISSLLLQATMAGPLAGAACCTTCCGVITAPAAASGPGMLAVFAGCEAACLASVGTMWPCTVCLAAFGAPTP